MGTTNDSTQQLTWRDIPWQSAPLPRLELVDPLTLTPTELLSYTADVQGDLRQMRELLSVTLARVVEQTDTLAAKNRTIAALRAENRTLRERAAA